MRSKRCAAQNQGITLIDKKFQSTAAVIFLVPHTTETKISSNMIHRKISKALFLFFALLLLVVVVVVLMRRGLLWEEGGGGGRECCGQAPGE